MESDSKRKRKSDSGEDDIDNRPKDGDELVMDETVYEVYHRVQTGAPCLSFDIIPDHLGSDRVCSHANPLTLYLMAGTQTMKNHANTVTVAKLSNIQPLRRSDKEDSDDSDEDSEDDNMEGPQGEARLMTSSIRYPGATNRIRYAKLGSASYAAQWSESKEVRVWRIDSQLQRLETSGTDNSLTKDRVPEFTFPGHLHEGFALDWSRLVEGRLATGACDGSLHVWMAAEGGQWRVDQRPFVGHCSSVEDIQWSPVEATVFASCGTDSTLRVWDIRAAPHKACMITQRASKSDVNVINWNSSEPFIVSGDDDGVLAVWDLRSMKPTSESGRPVASFRDHAGAVTSVEWNPCDSSVFAASGADDRVTLWDLSVERDGPEVEDVPAQLMFVHQGQTEVKELHWHPQIPGLLITTALDGFNVFKTISV